jgi:hypothetical protein
MLIALAMMVISIGSFLACARENALDGNGLTKNATRERLLGWLFVAGTLIMILGIWLETLLWIGCILVEGLLIFRFGYRPKIRLGADKPEGQTNKEHVGENVAK